MKKRVLYANANYEEIMPIMRKLSVTTAILLIKHLISKNWKP